MIQVKESLASDTFPRNINWLASGDIFESSSRVENSRNKGIFSKGVTLKSCNIVCNDKSSFSRFRTIATSLIERRKSPNKPKERYRALAKNLKRLRVSGALANLCMARGYLLRHA